MQINYINKLSYGGSNQTKLTNVKNQNQYTSDEWLTFLQAKSLNLKIKKGEQGTKIYKLVNGTKIDDKDKKLKQYQTYKSFTVFNLDQTTNELAQ